MPGFDGSGPLGQESKIGRALGNCGGANQNVQGNAPLGRGLDLRRGMKGRRSFVGRGRINVAPNNQINQQLIDEKNAMEEKVKVLEEKIKVLEEKHEL